MLIPYKASDENFKKLKFLSECSRLEENIIAGLEKQISFLREELSKTVEKLKKLEEKSLPTLGD